MGNHGGGPSRLDIQNIKILMETTAKYEMVHSTPEVYFKQLADSSIPMSEYNKSLNPCYVGCYTSQIRIKQKHCLLENELYMVEKMMSSASLQGYLNYPENELKKAFYKLMTAQFHDILPGSSIQPVEEASLRLMDYGLEIASELKGVFECEFMLVDQNWKDEFSMTLVHKEGKLIPSQPEKENSNIQLDWRKRVSFAAELEPSQRVNRQAPEFSAGD